ncbi:MAG: glycosyltransferase family 39 protein [Myxococcota bacterium]
MNAKGERLAAACCVATVALISRVIEAAQDVSMMNDGPRFLAAADAWLRGDWATLIRDDFHPGTGAAIALVGGLAGIDLELAARAISVVSGTLAAVVLFALVRDTLSPRVALASGLLFAVQPASVLASSSVQSDALHQLLALAGALAAWRALERGSLRAATAAGWLCGLAYLVRPEGLVVAAVLGAWLFAEAALRRLEPRRAALLGSGFALALLATAAPYPIAIHAQTGEWTLSQKKSLTAMLTLESASAPPAADAEGAPRILPALAEVAVEGLRAVHPLLFGLCLIGLPRRRPTRAELYLLSYPAAIFLVLLLLRLSYQYVSSRHWLVGAALLLPFAARGLLELADAASRLAPRLAPRSRAAAVTLFVTVACGVACVALDQDDPVKPARVEAARWLASHTRVTALAASRSRIAWYAGAGRYVQLSRDPDGQRVVEAAREADADYLIAEESRLPTAPGAALAGVEQLHEVRYRGGRVLVLKLIAPDRAATKPTSDAKPP